MSDWKTFLLKNKWVPVSILSKEFGIKNYDFTNFNKKPAIGKMLKPWRISVNQSPDRLNEIFKEAWKYYFLNVCNIDFDSSPEVWVPSLLSVRNVSRKKDGFSFLCDTRYFDIICPKTVVKYREHGFTNVALGAFKFWPGEKLLKSSGVLPYMFHQTHRAASDRISPEDMIEHVYLNFLSKRHTSDEEFAKELLVARYDEPGFISSPELAKFGVSSVFYQKHGGLKSVLESIQNKYSIELGFSDEIDISWSSFKFRKLFPNNNYKRCVYCNLSPVDLHHLLPRNEYPDLTYCEENIVPLCVQVHGLISRNYLNENQKGRYSKAIENWSMAAEGEKTQEFNIIMEELHEEVYGEV